MYQDNRSSDSCINIYIYYHYYYYYYYYYYIELPCNVMKMISVYFVEIDVFSISTASSNDVIQNEETSLSVFQLIWQHRSCLSFV